MLSHYSIFVLLLISTFVLSDGCSCVNQYPSPVVRTSCMHCFADCRAGKLNASIMVSYRPSPDDTLEQVIVELDPVTFFFDKIRLHSSWASKHTIIFDDASHQLARQIFFVNASSTSFLPLHSAVLSIPFKITLVSSRNGSTSGQMTVLDIIVLCTQGVQSPHIPATSDNVLPTTPSDIPTIPPDNAPMHIQLTPQPTINMQKPTFNQSKLESLPLKKDNFTEEMIVGTNWDIKINDSLGAPVTLNSSNIQQNNGWFDTLLSYAFSQGRMLWLGAVETVIVMLSAVLVYRRTKKMRQDIHYHHKKIYSIERNLLKMRTEARCNALTEKIHDS